jgi:CRISPR-associated protein Cas6/Cse3/CasE subtype I-E
MFLTRFTIDSDDPYHIHQVVKNLFQQTTRYLFRQHGGIVSVLSHDPPGKSCFDKSVEIIASEDATFPETGKQVIIQTTFCPTKNAKQERGTKSKCEGISDQGVAKEWLDHHLEGNGCTVVQSMVAPLGIRRHEKKDGEVFIAIPHQAIAVVTVTNSSAFQDLVSRGIGKCKFVGYGMLDIFG